MTSTSAEAVKIYHTGISKLYDHNTILWRKLKRNKSKWGLQGLDLEGAEKAFTEDRNAKLFIVVINNDENEKNKKNEKMIRYIHKDLDINHTVIPSEELERIKKEWDTLEKSVPKLKNDDVIRSCGKKVYELVNRKYLFSWGKVLGDDSKKLLSYLHDDLFIDWARKGRIGKSDDDKIITIEGYSTIKQKEVKITITINENEKEATLKHDGGETVNLKVKKENGELNICNTKIANSSDETSGVWIYCEDKMICPIWEWLYDEAGEFFWGDKLDIVRIPNGCDMSEKCTLNKLIIFEEDSLSGATGECMSNTFMPELKRLNLVSEKPSLDFFLKHENNQKVLNCMLYFQMNLKGVQGSEVMKIVCNGKNKNLILYLHTQLTGFDNHPSTWIDSSFDVQTPQSSCFFKCFCEMLDEHLGNANETNIAEIVTETRKKMCGQELNDQGGYNSCGRWKLRLPAFLSSHLPPAREESNVIGFCRLAFVVHGNPCTTFTSGDRTCCKLEQISSSETERYCG
jgi:DNA-directed RNA polymerase subunit H (RpoH/RPB5)